MFVRRFERFYRSWDFFFLILPLKFLLSLPYIEVQRILYLDETEMLENLFYVDDVKKIVLIDDSVIFLNSPDYSDSEEMYGETTK